MHTIVFCLEEPSAWEMLTGVLPKLLPDNVNHFRIIFEGKSDLDKRLVKRIRGWQTPQTFFLVLRDQDNSNCHDVKKSLVDKVTEAGRSDSVVRVACHELESFYLGDLHAVGQGLSLNNVAKLQDKQKFRSSDSCVNAAEELRRITNEAYQKISGSRAISPHLKLDNTNRSKSFNVLIAGIKNIVSRIESAGG